jgi:hypothetical protein
MNRGTVPAETVASAPELPTATEYSFGYTIREIRAMATIAPANIIFPE